MYEVREGALSIENSGTFDNLAVTISDSNFYGNGYFSKHGQSFDGSSIYVDFSGHSLAVLIANSNFSFNRGNALFKIDVFILKCIQLVGVNVVNNSYGSHGRGFAFFSTFNKSESFLVVESSLFSGNNAGSCIWCKVTGDNVVIYINDSSFTDSKPSKFDGTVETIAIFSEASSSTTVTFTNVNITNNIVAATTLVDGRDAVVVLISYVGDFEVNMIRVNFTSNEYLGHNGGALFVGLFDGTDVNFLLHMTECVFIDNKSSGHGAALYVYTELSAPKNLIIQIFNTSFDRNVAGYSVLYFPQVPLSAIKIQINNSNFTNNIGSSMYVSSGILHLIDNVLFENNTADYGAAVYLDQGSYILIDEQATVRFLNNFVSHNGGAIYIDMISICRNAFAYSSTQSDLPNVTFANNSAGLAGNSLYFDIAKFCDLEEIVNMSDPHSMMFMPCHFSYYQIINNNNVFVPCNVNYTSLNGTGSPIVTSSHELRLYFPNNDGVNISSNSDHNIYYINNNIFGHEVKFNGVLLDLFEKKAAPSLFNIECIDCSNVNISLLNDKNILIDNITNLSVKFMGANETNINVTLNLNLSSYSHPKVSTTLKVELVPCFKHPGNVYCKVTQTCVCYHLDVVECYDTYNEIRRGYWFGSIGGIPATTSLCPNHYCRIRKETRQGYFELPETVNAQCKKNRSGTACGKCSSNYTLAYDSTDCISVDHCSTGMTVLVVVLTCLYWIVVVVGVFSLVYFNFQISSGYVYGIIYYYSMVGILLSVNTNISDETFQLVRILSSFANLTPEFLGQLCFVTGLSGIDQLFIHYSHAVAVSILTLVIVLAARCSVRITVLVSRCIIRVICLLLLLSYTSLASTSLQLLRPLKFTGVNEVYTYVSPHIRYFHGHHAIYGIMAVICELVVGIGLPLLLLLEPLLNRKINFIKIKPLLDQFQGCYKDKYRWFAAYYLIFRQVVMLIVFVGNSNYYNMLFYLQTTLVVIAMIHMWAQPYKDKVLNFFDGLLLNIMLVIANINIYTLLQSVAPGITIALLVLPLFLCCLAGINLATHRFVRYFKKSNEYQPLDDLITANPARNNRKGAARRHPGYFHYQESLVVHDS
ncbi:uncharacterized protein [Dysidea avara]|uniref:uncharacterized protein n=1 Tax=Dysidea avara TaxID=196820 RepID=UPI00331D93F1